MSGCVKQQAGIDMGLFGIGDGKMELSLSSTDIYPGAVLEGTATLTLNTDVKAKKVTATLIAEREEMQYNMQLGAPVIAGPGAYGSAPQNRRTTVTLYKKEEILDSEKTYLKSNSPIQYKFSFTVPDLNVGQSSQSGLAGAIGSFVGSMGGVGTSVGPVRWYVSVKLDIPFAFDVSKKQELNAVAKPA